jgi:glycosyltransferase involved in cell wall biosynthesis
MARICLLASGQPSVDPRLVKEADALHEVGHDVQVICSHMVPWADAADRELLQTRSWTCTYVGGDSNGTTTEYWRTRLRHGLSRRLWLAWPLSDRLRRYSVCRVLPELAGAAMRAKAELYIAHYTGALVAAAEAARANRALFAFDAEDFETGSYNLDAGPSRMDRLIERFERQYLPRSAYITGASPGIAEAYKAKYEIPLPATILNVFPLAERPRELRGISLDRPLRLYWFSQTIGPGRGLEDVVQAMGQLKGCKIELHLRGRWAGSYKEALFSLATSVGLLPQQIYSHDPGPQSEMVRLAALYDVGLALERRDTVNRDLCITNKIFTYLLAGNAVIATATRGQRMIMETVGDAGFPYEPGDVNALAHGLRLWDENRNMLQLVRQKSWNWGTNRFNWDLEKKKLVQQVEDVLHDGRRVLSGN